MAIGSGEAFHKRKIAPVRTFPVIPGRTFGPYALATIGAAFDQAWQEVEGSFTGTQSREAGRLILANAILANAIDDSRDPTALKWIGIRVLACRGYLRAAETPRQKAMLAIIETQNLIEASRAELKRIRAGACRPRSLDGPSTSADRAA